MNQNIICNLYIFISKWIKKSYEIVIQPKREFGYVIQGF